MNIASIYIFRVTGLSLVIFTGIKKRTMRGAAALFDRRDGFRLILGLIFTWGGLIGPAAAGPRENPLPKDQAFHASARLEGSHVVLAFDVAEGYHLYKARLRFTPIPQDVALGTAILPEGLLEVDPEMGETEVYRGHVDIRVPVLSVSSADASFVDVTYQGCQDEGSCYPPMHLKVDLKGIQPPSGLASLDHQPPPNECSASSGEGFLNTPPPASEQCRIAEALKKDSLWLTAVSFLGMGLLLAFTPCIFPMIPILSGIIVGHGQRLTTRRAFLLSLSYVSASALAYTGFGVLAGLFGHNLQALFQDPRIIAAFSGLFVVLAFSMFGVFTLQVPGPLQQRLMALSNRQAGGTLLGSAVMGFLSALIVGPCVAAPLAGALIYIGQTGDALLGGLALFSLGLGMGLPLLVIGTSAGKLLPRAGVWMDTIKSIFGVALLGVALSLLERIIPPEVTLLLWAVLLILPSIFLGALDALPPQATFLRKVAKGLGVLMLAYGLLLLVGVATKAKDPLHPLEHLRAGSSGSSKEPSQLAFMPVKSVAELKGALGEAARHHQAVMLDFYADWCTACKEMERDTFTDLKVQEALKNVRLIQADVTETGADQNALLKEFGLIGPPAVLFFDGSAREITHRRVIGFMEPEHFVAHLSDLF
ncbi:MAG: protein-disulfide reductase DsbD [Methylococcus sp.]